MRLKIAITFILSSLISQAQFGKSGEVGFLLGASNYHGDLAHDVVFSETHFSAGVFYRYNFNEFWSYRPTLNYLQISGSDQNFEEYRLRNLSFNNTIIELANQFEFNYQPFSSKAFHKHATFYAFSGLNFFYHNPTTVMQGQEFDLRDYQTEPTEEGESRYSLFQLAVPIGVGYKHSFTPNFLIGFEIGWRRLFTDYLDDVSTVYPDLDELRANFGNNAAQLSDRSWEVTDNGSSVANSGEMRGDPNLNDWYMQAGFTISYRFTPIQCWSD